MRCGNGARESGNACTASVPNVCRSSWNVSRFTFARFTAAQLSRWKAGRWIHAIKVYREATGSGLKESKEAVEAMARSAGSRSTELAP